MEALLHDIPAVADVLVLTGDLTDTGLPREMDVLAGVLERLSLPIVAVLGNHDHESDRRSP